MDDFFHFISRLVIVIPIVIIIGALILKFNQKKENYSQKIIFTPTVAPTKTPIISSTPAIKFDLIGPLVCQINEKETSISAYVKDKKILLTKNEKGLPADKQEKVDYFLVKEDCLYWWEEGKYSGEKICGISSYLSYFEQLSQFGFMGMGNLDLGHLIGNCRKEEIKDLKIFEVPKNILFKNK